MEEDIISLLESVHPGESKKFPDIDSLIMTWKYISALPPNLRNIRLLYRFLKKKDIEKPKASLCIVHGFGEHSGRYINAAIHFALLGYGVHMIDFRHAGLSGGARAGHNLYELQSDINLLLQQPDPTVPCFLWGHSMGGLLVTTVLINNPTLPITGVIISAPFYGSSNADISKGKEIAMKLASPLINQGVFNAFICPTSVSRDDLYIRAMFEDKKMLPLLGSSMALTMIEHLRPIVSQATKMRHPVIFLHGNKDSLTFCEMTQQVYRNCGSKDKTMVVLEGGYHEPHHDLERDEFLKKISDWADQRLKEGKAYGYVAQIKIASAGYQKMGKLCKALIAVGILIYLGIAWKIRIPNMMALILKLGSFLLRLFWPITLLFKKIRI
ncbi:unnamed protein product [Blepharisma stoltei]|uniref:Serine aminopeptidase S33 domain-containing protein n=1 Tax=Blepharisma stoltei TaxID=1481888 RepID=A0AAU9K2M2_9CILI|nr:unnamed protein product [Blepharisma stoltei]